jgi:hypothetical protein
MNKREGYDPPLMVYLKAGTRAKLREIAGNRAEAKTIRQLVDRLIKRKSFQDAGDKTP